MYELTVTRDFSAAHFLRNYHGKCVRLHGHNCKVRLVVRGSQLDAAGMVVDFGVMKRMLDQVLQTLDHRCLNELAAFSELSPSCENLARYVFDECTQHLAAGKYLTPARVEVFETETNKVAYWQ